MSSRLATSLRLPLLRTWASAAPRALSFSSLANEKPSLMQARARANRAAKKAPAKGKGKKDVKEKKVAVVDYDRNYTNDDFWPFKEGAGQPIKPMSEYPEWLATVADPQPTLNVLTKMAAEDFDGMTKQEQRRFFKLKNRAAIKEFNLSAGK